jgi:glycosyltransferase involved in cell wall biosynthesis
VRDLKNTLYVVVPCYNEEEVLRETARRLGEKTATLIKEGRISEKSRVVFVDDGSRDSTWDIINNLCDGDNLFAGVGLSRNRGHQNALFAGLMTVRNAADMIISIDADLQDDTDAIGQMVDEYLSGCDIVYGVRESRKKDSVFKRVTAEGFYKLLRVLGADIVFNHADYRLMSSRALGALAEYGEQSLFLRGLVPMLGYKTAVVKYERGKRYAGESKYPLKKMLALAFNGAASLSLRPLRIITAIGAIMLIAAAALLIYLIVALCQGKSVLDWKIVTFSIWFIGGFIMLALGIVGEYVGRAYMETKRRPRYNIDRTAGMPLCGESVNIIEN